MRPSPVSIVSSRLASRPAMLLALTFIVLCLCAAFADFSTKGEPREALVAHGYASFRQLDIAHRPKRGHGVQATHVPLAGGSVLSPRRARERVHLAPPLGAGVDSGGCLGVQVLRQGAYPRVRHLVRRPGSHMLRDAEGRHGMPCRHGADPVHDGSHDGPVQRHTGGSRERPHSIPYIYGVGRVVHERRGADQGSRSHSPSSRSMVGVETALGRQCIGGHGQVTAPGRRLAAASGPMVLGGMEAGGRQVPHPGHGGEFRALPGAHEL